MTELFRRQGEGWADKTAVAVLDVGFGPCVSITMSDGETVVISDQQAELVHGFLTEAIRFMELHTDQQAQRDIEAATAGLDDQIALSFDDVPAEKDGGVSAEVVRTLKGD